MYYYNSLPLLPETTKPPPRPLQHQQKTVMQLVIVISPLLFSTSTNPSLVVGATQESVVFKAPPPPRPQQTESQSNQSSAINTITDTADASNNTGTSREGNPAPVASPAVAPTLDYTPPAWAAIPKHAYRLDVIIYLYLSLIQRLDYIIISWDHHHCCHDYLDKPL
jgi:hypothetical protein